MQFDANQGPMAVLAISQGRSGGDRSELRSLRSFSEILFFLIVGALIFWPLQGTTGRGIYNFKGSASVLV